MDNFLSASGFIIQRLIAQGVADADKIRAAPSDKWVVDNPLDGSISVIFFDDVPLEGRGIATSSDQHWQVVISAMNVSDVGNAARQDAGLLYYQVLIALQGWQPSSQHGPLNRSRSPFRATDNRGYVHIPLMFTTRVTVNGKAK